MESLTHKYNTRLKKRTYNQFASHPLCQGSCDDSQQGDREPRADYYCEAPDVLYNIGYAYANGIYGVKRNCEKAIYYYEKSGMQNALVNIGKMMYYNYYEFNDNDHVKVMTYLIRGNPMCYIMSVHLIETLEQICVKFLRKKQKLSEDELRLIDVLLMQDEITEDSEDDDNNSYDTDDIDYMNRFNLCLVSVKQYHANQQLCEELVKEREENEYLRDIYWAPPTEEIPQGGKGYMQCRDRFNDSIVNQ